MLDRSSHPPRKYLGSFPRMKDAQAERETNGYGVCSGLILGHLAFRVKVIIDTSTQIVFFHFFRRECKLRDTFFDLDFLDVEPQAAISSSSRSRVPQNGCVGNLQDCGISFLCKSNG